MYGQVVDQSTNQKKKIIIVSLIMGVIIIALVGVLVYAIINKTKRTNPLSNTNSDSSVIASTDNNNTDSGTTSTTDGSNSKTESAEDGNLPPVSEQATATVTPKSEVHEEIPSTGPEGIAGLALLVGAVSAYLLSKNTRKAFLF